MQLITVPIGGDMKISKEQLIEKLIPEVLDSLTLDDLRGLSRTMNTSKQDKLQNHTSASARVTFIQALRFLSIVLFV